MRWRMIAALVAMNDVLLTRVYGTIPSLPDSDNWVGKLLALVASLAISALGVFGWRSPTPASAQFSSRTGLHNGVHDMTAWHWAPRHCQEKGRESEPRRQHPSELTAAHRCSHGSSEPGPYS